MSTSKFKVEKFDDKNNFNIKREKMMAHPHFSYLGLDEYVKGEAMMYEDIENKKRLRCLRMQALSQDLENRFC